MGGGLANWALLVCDRLRSLALASLLASLLPKRGDIAAIKAIAGRGGLVVTIAHHDDGGQVPIFSMAKEYNKAHSMRRMGISEQRNGEGKTIIFISEKMVSSRVEGLTWA